MNGSRVTIELVPDGVDRGGRAAAPAVGGPRL